MCLAVITFTYALLRTGDDLQSPQMKFLDLIIFMVT